VLLDLPPSCGPARTARTARNQRSTPVPGRSPGR